MSGDQLAGTGACALAERIRAGECTAEQTLQAHLELIARVDERVGAFCSTFADRALSTARTIDARRAAGESLGALAGVPVASKDNLLVEGELATAGSRMLEQLRAPFTATSLARLERAHAVLIGRTNMDEFGMGSTTETSFHQRTVNPFGSELVPGGSSGGSAAAVAAGLAPLAIGSDTGGSVRQPASMCGVTGLKPTYGRVPRYGLIAYASSLDCVGAFARTAEDLALWLDCATGHDGADATSLRQACAPARPALAERNDLRGVRCGVPWQLNGPGIDDEVLAATRAATDHLRQLGAEVIECELASTQHAVPAYYLLAAAEASSNLARYDGVHYGFRRGDAKASSDETTHTRSAGFGDEVQLRILLGTFASSYGYSEQFYERARAARDAVRRDFARALTDCDVLLSPVAPTAAFRFDEHRDDPLQRYLGDALTVPASLAGVPALSMPCGATGDGRPVGLQVMAAHGRDHVALQLAHVFQQHSDHHHMRPDLDRLEREVQP